MASSHRERVRVRRLSHVSARRGLTRPTRCARGRASAHEATIDPVLLERLETIDALEARGATKILPAGRNTRP